MAESAGKRHPAYEGKEPYVFISYSRKDLEKVLPLFDALDQAGCRYWYDEGGIRAGEEFWRKIEQKIRGCTIFISFLSSTFLDSRYCRDEAKVARMTIEMRDPDSSGPSKPRLLPTVLRPFAGKYLQYSYQLAPDLAKKVLTDDFPRLIREIRSPMKAILPVHLDGEVLLDDSRYPPDLAYYQKLGWQYTDGPGSFIEAMQEVPAFASCKKTVYEEHTQDNGPTLDQSSARSVYDDSPTQHDLDRASKQMDLDIRLTGGIIGRGRHSVVYKGFLEGSGRLVVVKKDQRDLVQEYRALGEKFDSFRWIDHPYIAKYLSFIPDYTGHQCFIVMEYVPGKSIRQTVEDDGPMIQGMSLDWAYQILGALVYLHQQGKIHGHIQADNIILTPVADMGRMRREVRLIDYSLKAPWKDDTQIVHDVFGKVGSDEDFHRGVQTDICGAGEVLFLLLTGCDPQKGMDKEAVLRSCGVTGSVGAIVCKAIDGEYGSAGEMLEELRHLAVGDPRKRYITRSAIRSTVVSLAVLFLGFGLYTLGNHYLFQQALTGVPQAADGEMLKRLGMVLMLLFPVVSVALLLRWRRARDRGKDALLRDYGEMIYYGEKTVRDAIHVKRIFQDTDNAGHM